MKRLIIIIGIILLAFWLFGGRDTWQGFYYPDGCLMCEDKYIYSPIFSTKEECFDWADELKISRNNAEDLFECGLNCEDKGGFNVCDETVD